MRQRGGGQLTTLVPGRQSRLGTADRLRALTHGLDWVLVAATVAVSGFGLYMVRAATRTDLPDDPGYFFQRQLIATVLGLLCAAAVMSIGTERLARHAWTLWGILLGALVVVMVIGTSGGGAERWIEVGFFRFQPSELGKIAIAVVVAALVCERRGELGTPRLSLVALVIVAVPGLIVFLQPDLGTTLVYFAILATILFIAGVPWKHFAAAAATVILVAVSSLWLLPAVGVKVLQDYQVDRLTSLVNSSGETASRSGYQQDQSETAIGAGGAFGKGPDNATQTNNDFLPEHHTDFIFAVVGEMFGFVGGAALIVLLAVILWRGLRIVARAGTQLDQLVAAGVVAMLSFQVFVNIGMTVGIMPITGITLPFVSYGGSHTLTNLIAVALLLRIHQRRAPGPA